ncbi:VWA domain-containing protein, partial [Streptomyces sp. SID6013]|nr:VWA domain-containing protein [Streptomyces sp. SID6013]
PHEESGAVETDALDGSVWEAGRGLRVTATAAYFADALRSPDGDRSSLPGAPGLSELSGRADGLADRTEDEDVRELAEAIEEADRLT